METLLSELLELLEDEIEIFRFLLPVFKKEKKAVLASDLNELNKTLAEKEKLLFNMRSIEKKRTHIIKNRQNLLNFFQMSLS
jgi:flagellar biosynthesis/type III secretory pathway chaperone